jgi:uncharacterized protein DUF1707
MTESPELRPAPLKTRRDEVIRVLQTAFADDHLSVEELERRLDVAHRATAIPELDALTSDLRITPVQPTTLPIAAPRRNLPSEIPETQTLVAVMGGVARRGQWTPARHTHIYALMGGGELDFRDARLGAGVTELTIIACMGGVEIIVPPDLVVDCGGTAIMGGFDQAHDNSAAPPGAPVLKINGFVLMGGVEIKVMLPGETNSDARRRRREERKQRRRGQT